MKMHGKPQEASVQIENVSRRISAAVLRGGLEGDWRAVKRVVDDIQSLGELGRPGEDVVLQPLVLLQGSCQRLVGHMWFGPKC